MNWFDAALALPLIWGLYRGVTSGLIMEVARLVGLIAGIAVGVGFANVLADIIYKNTDVTNDLLPIIAFGFIFISVVILVHLFAKLLQSAANAISLALLNKLGGALFGILRMAFLMSTVILLFTRADLLKRFNDGETAQTSLLYGTICTVAQRILPVLDQLDRDSLFDKTNRKFDKVKDALRDAIPE